MSWLTAALLAQAISIPFNAGPISDHDLAQMRGGFSLPNGINIALAVQTQTKIDGAVVLRTVFQADEGPSRFIAYVPTTNGSSSIGASGQRTATTTPPVIDFDNRNGIRFAPGVTLPLVGSGSQAKVIASSTPDGFAAVAPDSPTKTGSGVVNVSNVGPNYHATLESAMLSISHVAGQAFGSVVANAADNRSIDVESTVDLRLAGVSPDTLGSSMFRVENTAIDALRSRTQ